jgi:hypothetical protein
MKVRLPQRSRRVLSWTLFLVVIGAAVLFFVLWRQAVADRNAAQRADRDRAEVASTATDFLNALTNFKGTTIEQDVARIKGFAVDGFASQVDQFFGPAAVSALRKAHAESVGRVQRVFIESLSGDEADVFAVVDETITNSSTSSPKAQTLRIEMGMIHAASGWKVNRVDILQSPQNPAIPGG